MIEFGEKLSARMHVPTRDELVAAHERGELEHPAQVDWATASAIDRLKIGDPVAFLAVFVEARWMSGRIVGLEGSEARLLVREAAHADGTPPHCGLSTEQIAAVLDEH